MEISVDMLCHVQSKTNELQSVGRVGEERRGTIADYDDIAPISAIDAETLILRSRACELALLSCQE